MRDEPTALSNIPPVRDGDDDDVAWALQTASVQWARGGRADALVWLRRAIEAAIRAGVAQRAAELMRAAETLESPETEVEVPASRPEPDSIEALLYASHVPVADPFDEPFPGFEDSDGAIELEPELETEIEPEPIEPELALEVEPEPEPESEMQPVDVQSLVSESLRGQELAARSASEYPLDEPSDFDTEVEPDESDDLPTLPPPPPAMAMPLPPAPLPPPLASPPAPQAWPLPPAPLPSPLPEPDTFVEAQQAQESAPSEPPEVQGIALGSVRGLEDLPVEAQRALAQGAHIDALGPEEEFSGFGMALIVEGSVSVMPAIVDASCGLLQSGDVLFTTGSLEDGVSLRIVAGEDGAVTATWRAETLEQALIDTPWVADDVRRIADRFQALAGVAMGAMGERLDDTLRGMVTDRCEVRTLRADEVLVEQGARVAGMHIVGAGRIELSDSGGAALRDELGPGEFLFTEQVLAHGAAPRTARAGKGGALVLVADRMTAHELMVSVPPLLEILAS